MQETGHPAYIRLASARNREMLDQSLGVRHPQAPGNAFRANNSTQMEELRSVHVSELPNSRQIPVSLSTRKGTVNATTFGDRSEGTQLGALHARHSTINIGLRTNHEEDNSEDAGKLTSIRHAFSTDPVTDKRSPISALAGFRGDEHSRR